MSSIAKGIKRYVGIAALAVGISCSGADAAPVQDACSESSCPVVYEAKVEEPELACYHEDSIFSEASVYCDDFLQGMITGLELTVTLSDQTMRLEGLLGSGPERCTLLEQRTILGKKGWETPKMESDMKYANINPVWYIPNSILAEMLKEHSASYVNRFCHKDGCYILPGPNNPLGAVAFHIENSRGIKLHGTINKELFNNEDRFYSHGCIRTEDEVKLLKTINELVGNSEDCDGACIDKHISSGKTHKLVFNKTVHIKIVE